jgi:hypothetical protein
VKPGVDQSTDFFVLLFLSARSFETDAEKNERLSNWGKFLEADDEKDEDNKKGESDAVEPEPTESEKPEEIGKDKFESKEELDDDSE